MIDLPNRNSSLLKMLPELIEAGIVEGFYMGALAAKFLCDQNNEREHSEKSCEVEPSSVPINQMLELGAALKIREWESLGLVDMQVLPVTDQIQSALAMKEFTGDSILLQLVVKTFYQEFAWCSHRTWS